MYFLPCLAKFGQVIPKFRVNALCLVFRETRLPQTQWAIRTIQIEDGSMPLADDVNMRRQVVVGVDDDSQAPQSQDGWHESSVP
jgi:hypothetical protein